MSGRILDGKRIGAAIRADAAEAAREFARGGRLPGLAVVLVGDDPASAIYVRERSRRRREVGIISETHRLPATTKAPELAGLLERLNQDESVDAILLQLLCRGGSMRRSSWPGFVRTRMSTVSIPKTWAGWWPTSPARAPVPPRESWRCSAAKGSRCVAPGR